MSQILLFIEQKKEISQLVEHVIHHPEEIEVLIKEIQTNPRAVKFTCEKILRLITEKTPEICYPYFDFYSVLMDNDNHFLKWGAIIAISNLAKVDKKDKLKGILDRYLDLMIQPSLITAVNTIKNVWKIVHAKPVYTEKVLSYLLQVETVAYLHKKNISKECHHIACGAAVEAFEKIIDYTSFKDPIIAFVRRQQENPRLKVKKAVARFLRKHAS